MSSLRSHGVFVITPPPSETIMVATGSTFEEAKEAAMAWADGQIDWATPTEGISAYGEKVVIEEIKIPVRRGDAQALSFLTWDEIFETSVLEQYFAPELGFTVKYGEVVPGERKRFREIWGEAIKWISDALHARRIDAYSLQGSRIYKYDLKEMIQELKRRRPSGPKDWEPGRRRWELALATTFGKLLEVNR